MPFKVVIPARYASTRLPGKPLCDINGKPMIAHVYERALESGADEVVIATDDPRIVDAAAGFGAVAMLTAETHHSGTDRVAEVARRSGWLVDTVVVNLQGDEPAMPGALIRQVAAAMEAHSEAAITTLCAPIRERHQLFDPHVVKVVRDAAGFALYFSRAPIPWHREEFARDHHPLPQATEFARHIGLYAYRVGYLGGFVTLPPAPIEQAESLEQLRALWHGAKIHVGLAQEEPGHGVDTEADLERMRGLLGR